MPRRVHWQWCVRPDSFALLSGGIHSHYAQVGRYRVHYYEGGEGPPLVFVHGLGAESLNWVPAMLELSPPFPRVRHRPARPRRQTERPDIAYSITQQSEMLHQFLADQNALPADVVGVSMGGWVTLKLALDHPDVVNRLSRCRCCRAEVPDRHHGQKLSSRDARRVRAFMAMLTPRQCMTRPIRCAATS